MDERTGAGDRMVVTRVPVIALRIYEGDSLRFVAPATIESRRVSVQDAIELLANAGSLDSLVDSPSVDEATRKSHGG